MVRAIDCCWRVECEVTRRVLQAVTLVALGKCGFVVSCFYAFVRIVYDDCWRVHVWKMKADLDIVQESPRSHTRHEPCCSFQSSETRQALLHQ